MRYNRLILFTVAVLIFFSACSGSPGVIVSDFEKFDGIVPDGTEITIKHEIRSGSIPVFHAFADEFNNKNKFGIVINLEAVADNTFDSGDIVIVNPSEAANLLRTGRSIELSPFIYHPSWGIEGGRSIFFKAACRQTDYWDFSKRITSLPLLMDAGILIVNNEILDDTGFKMFPRSWAGMDRLLRKSGNELHHPSGMELDSDSLVAVLQSRGGSILGPFGLGYSIHNPVVNRTIRSLRRYEKKELLSINRTKYINQTDFAFGKLLAVYTGIDGIKAYEKMLSMVNPDLEWSIELLPTRKPGNGISINSIYSAAVMAGPLENQLASWIFIKWLTEPEQQKKLAVETGSIPAVADVLSDIIIDREDLFPAKWLDAVELINNSDMDYIPGVYDYNYVSEQFEMMVDRVMNGRWVWLETLKLERKLKKDRRNNSGKKAGTL